MSAIHRNGWVYWRGSDLEFTCCSIRDAVKLRDQFANVEPTDWFYPTAQRFATELDDAINQATEHAEVTLEQRVGMDQLEHV